MGWIILTVFCILAAMVGVGYAIYSNKVWGARVKAWESAEPNRYGRKPDAPTNYALVGWGVAGAALALWVLVSGFMVFKTVGQREVAIVYNFSGTISGKRDPGIVTIAPWQHIKKENIGIQHEEWNFGQENSAVSLDQQKVFANLAVNYQVDPEKVVDLYKRVGPSWKSIIVDARVPQVFKEVTATYQTQDITARREQLRTETRARLATELNPYDIKVVDVFVTNLGFSQVYTDSIEAKQKQVQDAQRAEAKIREAKAIAQQKVEAAKGERDANIARAEGDARANRLRQRSLTPLLVQWEAIQKLNPSVQTIICPPQSVCIPNSGVVPVPSQGNG
jgi:regulator of protease activity HflC (stomatin/prohibitin superfamily)